MYSGQWKEKGPKGHAVEHGFGISSNNYPDKYKGMVYIGEWKNGTLDGEGESFWLEESNTWKRNHFPGSAVTALAASTGRQRGVPFYYRGGYKKGVKCSDMTVVTLKDGTSRRGPWKNGAPVGKWLEEYESVATTTSGSRSGRVVAAPRAAAAPRPAVTVKQEPSEENNSGLIRLLESDEEEEEEGKQDNHVATSRAIKQEPGTSDNDKAWEEKEKRIGQIHDWITMEVVVHNPDPHAMGKYAQKLYDEGYQSVEMIQAHLTQDDIQEFT